MRSAKQNLDADVVRVISVAKKILAYNKVRDFFETTQNCSECAVQNKILDADVVRVISVAKKILAYNKVREFFETTQNCSECAADKMQQTRF